MYDRVHRSIPGSDELGSAHGVAVVLTIVTGIIHFYKGLGYSGWPLLLAGLGFFGGVALFVAGFHRRLLYAVGTVYTVAQVVLWINMGLPYIRLGVLDKLIQLSLIGMLLYLFVRDG